MAVSISPLPHSPAHFRLPPSQDSDEEKAGEEGGDGREGTEGTEGKVGGNRR